jgi:hypothetical protein
MASSSLSLKAWLTQGSRDYILEETLTFIKRGLGIHELGVEVGEALQYSPYTTIIRISGETFTRTGRTFK